MIRTITINIVIIIVIVIHILGGEKPVKVKLMNLQLGLAEISHKIDAYSRIFNNLRMPSDGIWVLPSRQQCC